MTLSNLWQGILFVLKARHPTVLQLAYSVHYLFLEDFVTELPVSKGNTALLAIVDRFSKASPFCCTHKIAIFLKPLNS